MSKQSGDRHRYLAAVILGAVAGGIVVALATRAIPKIMSRIMSQLMSQMRSEMPQKMMARMKAEGIDPAEMCQRMMANFNPPPSSETSTE